jgi:hypothetical protein
MGEHFIEVVADHGVASRRKAGSPMLEHDGNPLEVTFQFERLPQLNTLSFASALAGVADVVDEGLDQRTHSSIL